MQGGDFLMTQLATKSIRIGHAMLAAAMALATSVAAEAFAQDSNSIRRVNISHIMVKERADAQRIYSQLKTDPADRFRERFHEAAGRFSIDTETARKGGDLGYILEGELDRGFEQGVFAQPVGVLSEPIRSAFGWHVVIVHKADTKPTKELCVETLADQMRSANADERKSLLLSAASLSLEQLEPALRDQLGSDGVGFVDWNNDLSFVGRTEDLANGAVKRLVIAIEHREPRYIPTAKACNRSTAIFMDVDCRSPRVAILGKLMYEGRAGAGRLLDKISFTDNPSVINTGPSGYYKQIADKACGRNG